ncbi:hypothetical protein [Athalassotoga sp.]|uniref:hypothetical protein n=1 Tax=Athalassotoga sp. TaxID=2022597 RepID=UPI003CFFCC51
MKDLLIDKSQDFFLILEKEKSEWPAFYFEYVKNAPYIFSNYHRIFNLDEEAIKKRILSFERRFLDKVFQSLPEIGPYKYEVARAIVSKAESMDLAISDFHFYIVGGLDFDPVTVIDEQNTLIDVLALYRVGFENLEDLCVKISMRR